VKTSPEIKTLDSTTYHTKFILNSQGNGLIICVNESILSKGNVKFSCPSSQGGALEVEQGTHQLDPSHRVLEIGVLSSSMTTFQRDGFHIPEKNIPGS
jgi:hypothetical protein